MNNIIHVNFKNRSRTDLRGDELYFGFLDVLRNLGLDENDVQDVLDGIRDLNHYNTLDADLKHIVDAWHVSTVNL
jgi:hypothetical protein